MKINKHIKGASTSLVEAVAPIRMAVAEFMAKDNLTKEELDFAQNELRRLSREIKRHQKRELIKSESVA